MKWLDRLLGRQNGHKTSALMSLPDFLRSGSESKSGQVVSYKTALEVTTVLACVRVIADGLAQVPFEIRKHRPGGGSDAATSHPLYLLLHRKPNSFQTSFEFRETVLFHMVLCGNAFVFMNKVRGQIRELIPIEPSRVKVDRNPDLSLRYTITQEDGSGLPLTSAEIWHLRGPSWNGWMGMEAIRLAREAIGLSLALESAHAHLHKNGVQPSGVYSVEGDLTEEQQKKLVKWLKKAQGGDPMVLDMSAKWLTTQMTGVDSQHVETRKLQIEEVCRAFRVIPLMVGLSDKSATYASAEQMFIAHVVHCLAPWAERLEQSADNTLLGDDVEHYTVLNLRGLIRGALKDQAEYYAKALGSGGSPAWMSQDEVRDELDLNPMGGPAALLREPSNVGAPAPAA